jgi:murein DD-endopeptidase MepM/ murein hydrolase activator NlpD
MVDKFGHRSVLYDPRKSVPVRELFTIPPKTFDKSPIDVHSAKKVAGAENAERPAEQPPKATPRPRTVYNRPAIHTKSKSGRLLVLPISHILIIFAALVFAVLVFYWQMRSPAARYELIAPGEDDSILEEMAAYAGLEGKEYVDESFPMEITQIFSSTPYTVKSGDTVSQIAKNNKVSMDAIIALNNITNARLLTVGKVLKIPNMDGVPYIVQSTDTYQKIADAHKVPLSVILDANDIQNEVINPGDTLFIPGAHMKREDLKLALGDYFMWPLKDRRITSPYGWRTDPFTGIGGRIHEGIDFSAKTGTPVRSAMDGKVVMLGSNAIYGKYIIISHANNFKTLYGHLSAYSVKTGSYVTQGAKIGESGGTGHVTGAHLHFGIYKNDKSVNPLDYLAK